MANIRVTKSSNGVIGTFDANARVTKSSLGIVGTYDASIRVTKSSIAIIYQIPFASSRPQINILF